MMSVSRRAEVGSLSSLMNNYECRSHMEHGIFVHSSTFYLQAGEVILWGGLGTLTKAVETCLKLVEMGYNTI
jgi:hypothetical protein